MLKKLFRRRSVNGPGALRRVINTPLLVIPDVAAIYASVVMKRHGIDGSFSMHDDEVISRDNVMAANTRGATRAGSKLFHQNRGIAVLPVEGTLVHKYGNLDPVSGMTGYDGLEAKINAAMSDPTVQGILLDMDSPGGEVSGCFGLADMILKARAVKPIWAMVDEMACSAAYAIAASCSRVLMTDTAAVGSVGVVMMHADFSQQLENDGVDVTLIHAGAHKVDGNPYSPLPASVRADWQTQLEAIRGRFAQSVAAGRNINVGAVLGTEARTLMAPEAMDLGLVDGIMSAHSVVEAFLDSTSKGNVPGQASASRLRASPSNNRPTITNIESDHAAASHDNTRPERSAYPMPKPLADPIFEPKGREMIKSSKLASTTSAALEINVSSIYGRRAVAMGQKNTRYGLTALPVHHTEPEARSHTKTLIDPAEIYALRAAAMGQATSHVAVASFSSRSALPDARDLYARRAKVLG